VGSIPTLPTKSICDCQLPITSTHRAIGNRQ
jgi:hypothetical protein